MEDISFFAIRTLIFMKLKIFFKEYIYSIISPLISSILFILILIILSNYYKFSSNNNYINFIIPGIIMMIIFQETFSNISETIITLKHSGTFKDIIISPISRVEIAIAYLISIMIIGLIIGSINLIVINFILDFTLYNYLRFFYYIALASLIFGSMGAIVGFLSYSWETQQGLFNFFITPVSLLSGTFFSISSIENNLKNIFFINPFYYLVGNFRKSFEINSIYNVYSDILLSILAICFIFFALYIFKTGYKVID